MITAKYKQNSGVRHLAGKTSGGRFAGFFSTVRSEVDFSGDSSVAIVKGECEEVVSLVSIVSREYSLRKR